MNPDPRIMARMRQSLALFVPPTGKDRGLGGAAKAAKGTPRAFTSLGVEVLRHRTRHFKPEGAPP